MTFFENRAVYDLMWQNIVERDRPHMTIWRMRVASRILTATNTHSEYVIIIDFSTAIIVAQTSLNVTLYMHCLYCYCQFTASLTNTLL